MTARDDRGHAGAHRTFSHFNFTFATDQSRVTDLNAGDIGNGVKFSRRSIERNPEIARADGFRLRRW